MRIINFLWHFSTGGIGKCFLTYDQLGNISNDLQIKSVCIILDDNPCDYKPLSEQGIEIIHIKKRNDFTWLKKLERIVKIEQPNAFFCHGFNGPIMIYLFKLLYNYKIPMICTCHGVNLDKTKLGNKIIERIWMSIYRKKCCKKIICVEKFTHQDLYNTHIEKEKIVTVYNGIEPSVKTNQLDLSAYQINDPIIITASRLTRIKGINYLIDALATLKIRNVKFHYFCIGNGEEEQSLKLQAQERGLTDKDIHFMGYQDNIPEWLNACDIFALPSLEEFHSIAILEAMRAQKAIVATNVGGNPESLRDEKDALLVPSMDIEALADALTRLITNPELRNSLSKNAYEQFRKRFTIDVMMKNLTHEILTTRL